MKDTIRVEIWNKDNSMKGDYKLINKTKFEHLFNYLKSELRSKHLLHVIEGDNSRDVDKDKLEQDRFIVRDIIINRRDQAYYNRIVD